MTYEQVRTIVERVRGLHRRMRDYLEEARSHVVDPRMDYLLDRFRKDEQEMNLALAKYENSGERSVLDTWIQYIPDDELRSLSEELEFSEETVVEAVTEKKARFDEALASFYRQLTGQTSVPRVVDFFDAMARLTEQRIENEVWQSSDSDMAPGGPPSRRRKPKLDK